MFTQFLFRLLAVFKMFLTCSLIKDSTYIEKVKQTIKQTVLQYALPVCSTDFIACHAGEVEFDINNSQLWDVHILNIRSETVTYIIHCRRQTRREEELPVNKITELKPKRSESRSSIFYELEINKNKLEHMRR